MGVTKPSINFLIESGVTKKMKPISIIMIILILTFYSNCYDNHYNNYDIDIKIGIVWSSTLEKNTFWLKSCRFISTFHQSVNQQLVKVDPGKLYEDCVFDYCSCTGPKSNCFCPIFSTYGDQCTEKVKD